jgi:hypothetical protein
VSSQTTLRLFSLGLTLASSLFVACAPGEAPPVAQNVHKLGPFIPYNSAQAFGGQINGNVIRGIHRDTSVEGSPEGWWLRSSGYDHFAPVLDMTFGGAHVINVTTDQGWLLIETEGGYQGRFDAAGAAVNKDKGQANELYVSLGAPLNTALRIRHQSDESSYGKYNAEWLGGTGGGWTSFCPHPYQFADNTQGYLTEYMIPVGGAAWEVDGSKTVAGADTIQLSCTHDSVGACATWGYLPWDETLAGAHQACTRMKRGDFCGFGDPATTVNSSAFDHTAIQVWDSLGLNDAYGQTWSTVEAYWNEGGAVCLTRDNYRTTNSTAKQRMLTTVGNRCPQLPACEKSSAGLLASARPCSSYDDDGTTCLSN